MPRPTKWRRNEFVPTVPYYVPAEKEAESVEENILLLEELEAIRLRDLEGMEHVKCAEEMGVSGPTFQRILLSARKKIADSLVNGKMIHVNSDKYTMNVCGLICLDCQMEWQDTFEVYEKVKRHEFTCPNCDSKRVECQTHPEKPLNTKVCQKQYRYH